MQPGDLVSPGTQGGKRDGREARGDVVVHAQTRGFQDEGDCGKEEDVQEEDDGYKAGILAAAPETLEHAEVVEEGRREEQFGRGCVG